MRYIAYRALPIFCVCFSLATIIYQIYFQPYHELYKPIINTSQTISGTIAADPTITSSGTSFTINQINISDHPLPGKIFITVSTRPGNNLERSDHIKLNGKISDGFGPYSASLYRPSIVETSKPDPPDPALVVRHWFTDNIKRYISSPEAELSLGYLLGSNESLPTSLVEILSIVALTHIVVASGYNLSVLVRFSRRTLLPISRLTALTGGVVLILCFIAITGMSPSMLRASVVSVFSLIAWHTGRTFHPIRLLLLSATITLMIDPQFFIDIGWQLSFAAFAGVLILAPLLTQLFYGKQEPNFLASTLLETLGATIATLPIIVYYSGQFFLISILPNLFILPTIPITMALTFLTGILAFIPPIASVFAFCAQLLLRYHIAIATFFSQQSWALLQFDSNNLLLTLAITIIVILLMISLRLITKHRLHQPLLITDATPILR